MLSWMGVQQIKCLGNFPEVGGQSLYRFLHHSWCANSCLDVLFHYLTSGRFTSGVQASGIGALTGGVLAKACEIDLVPW